MPVLPSSVHITSSLKKNNGGVHHQQCDAEWIKHLVDWRQNNNLTLNVKKTEEIICFLAHQRLHSVKVLEMHMGDDLSWTLNTTYITKKAQQHRTSYES